VIRYLQAPTATLALRALAAVALTLACIAPEWIAPRVAGDTVVLVDRSLSVPTPAADAAWAAALRQRDRPATLLFAGDVVSADTTEPRNRAATDLEQAIRAGIQALRAGPVGELIVISDGRATEGATERALESARAAQIAVNWIGVGRPMPAARIVSVEAPDTVAAGQLIPVQVTVAGESSALRVVASTSDGQQEAVEVPADGKAARSAGIDVRAARPGPVTVFLGLADSDGRAVEPARPAALVMVQGAPRILYVARNPGALAGSLAAGGWPVDRVSPERAPVTDEALTEYGSVIVENVAVPESPPGFWSSLARAVRERGLGLAVLGGPDAFAAGGYRGSELESVLPVTAEPTPEEASAAVAFVVDKSGSMGRGSSGVDRLSVARSAVIATAAGLPPSAQAALISFDVTPRVLVPLTPYARAAQTITAPWPIAAGGGTRIGPALESAASLLSGSRAARRIVVLATDGYVGAESLAAARSALTDARAELVILAIGADADLPALATLIQGTQGEVLPVAAVAELPDLMRSAFARHVGRVVRGPFAVRTAQPLPFPPEDATSWPEVSAYAPVRARAGATVFLETDSGDPLLATQSFGTGITAALPAGLGPWTPEWLRSSRWPGFSGGLIDWISRGRSDPSLAVQLAERFGSLSIAVDAATGPEWSRQPNVTLKILGPDGRLTETAARAQAPGRYVATVPVAAVGAYQVTAMTGHSRSERSVLVVGQDENEQYGLSPLLDDWSRAGLIRRVDPSNLPPPPRAPDARAGRSWLAAVALLLFLIALAIDYRAVWHVHRTAIMGRVMRR